MFCFQGHGDDLAQLFLVALLKALLETFLAGQAFDTRKVWHVPLCLVTKHVGTKRILEVFRQVHDPIHQPKQLAHVLLGPAPFVKSLHQRQLQLRRVGGSSRVATACACARTTAEKGLALVSSARASARWSSSLASRKSIPVRLPQRP
jgi:hypothetical protein